MKRSGNHPLAEVIYLDNASTVFPKPGRILAGMVKQYHDYGTNPGRAGMSTCERAGELVTRVRRRLAAFFGSPHAERLTFAHNASDAMNSVLQGMLKSGDHVVTSTLEHNCVLRPLNHLAREGLITFDLVSADEAGHIDPEQVARLIKPNTRLVAISHGSNVLGTIQPLAAIGRICREHDVHLVVDAAQTAGMIPIDVQEMGIDVLVFTGHKSLLGPTGTGGSWIGRNVEIRSTRFGGTGSNSAALYQPREFPHVMEVGTQNILGIGGLDCAQDYREKWGHEKILRHGMSLFTPLFAGLHEITGVRVYGPPLGVDRLPLVSFNITGLPAMEVAVRLDQDYGIITRPGLHCAPLVHKQLGTIPEGAVRISLGPFNTEAEIKATLAAVIEIAAWAG